MNKNIKIDLESPGNRLIKTRKNLNLNQKTLAEVLELPAQYLSAMEKGKKKVTLRVALTLNSKYNLSVNWLIGGKGEMFESKGAPALGINQLWHNLYDNYPNINKTRLGIENIQRNIKDLQYYIEEYYLKLLNEVENSMQELSLNGLARSEIIEICAEKLKSFDPQWKIIDDIFLHNSNHAVILLSDFDTNKIMKNYWETKLMLEFLNNLENNRESAIKDVKNMKKSKNG